MVINLNGNWKRSDERALMVRLAWCKNGQSRKCALIYFFTPSKPRVASLSLCYVPSPPLKLSLSHSPQFFMVLTFVIHNFYPCSHNHPSIDPRSLFYHFVKCQKYFKKNEMRSLSQILKCPPIHQSRSYFFPLSFWWGAFEQFERSSLR